MTEVLTSQQGQTMMGYLPPFYADSRIMQVAMQARGNQFDQLFDTLNEILNQFFASTATWGLDQWESDSGLPISPSLPDDQRRSRIISKTRGWGTATPYVVKQVANAYQNGTVESVEDFAAYTIYIIFVDDRGIPPNLSDLQSALRDVIPAHIDIKYVYRYTVYSDLDGHYTYDQLDNSGLTYDQLMTQLP